ncbi:glycine-rich RNA-binding protein GRP1A-like [Prosopis cineraria]|uniref:glycine-rich RNA-binding protein GRP1A-like n=1 Tax=Prosopis cineraria TaxID=364024 RepID=UPI0024105753|nr:glycine-rich RNA-binding protein GRP1A-like [Prosopis cineraria]
MPSARPVSFQRHYRIEGHQRSRDPKVKRVWIRDVLLRTVREVIDGMDGQSLDGRNITVNKAQSRGRGGSGYGSGSGGHSRGGGG